LWNVDAGLRVGSGGIESYLSFALKSGQDRGIVFAIEISLIGQLARSKAR
jgi:hypothetical protein